MFNRNIILKITAVSLIAILIFLFLHSETELFDKHNDSCKDLDLCLILDKANFENNHDVDIFLKITHDIINVSIVKLNHSIQLFIQPDKFSSYFHYKTADKIYLTNLILLI